MIDIISNECVDDGRGDSPRLRPFDSPPRPSHETLIFGVHPIWKPKTGLPCPLTAGIYARMMRRGIGQTSFKIMSGRTFFPFIS